VKGLSLGMPRWFIPAYFKKTQASKLGDAQGIPFFIDNIIRSLLVKLYFYSVTFLCSLLGASVCFYFCFVLNKVGSRHPYIGDITLRFFIWNTCVLNCALMFMAKAEIASLNCYLVGIRKCCIWFGNLAIV
jgi:hypothetical protein